MSKPTARNTKNTRLPGAGGANPNDTSKSNYTAKRDGNHHGSISFGHIHQTADVTSAVKLENGADSRHVMSMDADGQRKGWTTIMSPGNFQVEAGSDRTEPDDVIMINAKNGNIDIIATNGKIRMQGTDIELIAVGDGGSKGNIRLTASENISNESKKFLVTAKTSYKIASPGTGEVCANSVLKIYGSIMRGVTDACAKKDSKTGNQRYQQQCNQV